VVPREGGEERRSSGQGLRSEGGEAAFHRTLTVPDASTIGARREPPLRSREGEQAGAAVAVDIVVGVAHGLVLAAPRADFGSRQGYRQSCGSAAPPIRGEKSVKMAADPSRCPRASGGYPLSILADTMRKRSSYGVEGGGPPSSSGRVSAGGARELGESFSASREVRSSSRKRKTGSAIRARSHPVGVRV
jgi:hypothetical protein